jgi:hypothetical protein
MYSAGSKPTSVAVGDFNDDNRLDIVVANGNSNDVSVLLGYSEGSFMNQISYATGSKPQSVAVGDFNNDNYLDIVDANYFSSHISVLLGDIDIAFIKRTTLPTHNLSRPRSFIIGDYNNDFRMDIAVANSGSDSIEIFLGYADFSFENRAKYSAGVRPISIAAGDFDNDTRLDIVVANYGSENVGIFRGYGNGMFSNQTTYSTGAGSYPYSVATGDFDNDGTIDIVVANQGTNNLGIFLGNGNGAFSNMLLFSIGYGSLPFAVVVGDFNNDENLDCIVANEGTDSLSVLLQTCDFRTS